MRNFSHWLEKASPSESIDFYRELALSHAREGGAIGAEIAVLIRRDDLRALVEFEFNYQLPGLTASEVRHARQALAFFSKIQDLEIGIDKEKVAFEKFLDSEALCKESNELFRARRSGSVSFRPDVERVFVRAQRKIAEVLGRAPTLGELELHFGPGATRATKRKDASIRRKLAEKLQCSEDLFGAVKYVLEEMPHLLDIHSVQSRTDEDGDEWELVPVEITPARLNFVPKNAKTLRAICTEPGLNVTVQLGLGAWMAKRLAAFGIDIRDQSVNQRRALEGSLTGALATLDLSSASDTISTELVYELLPLDWAVLLNRARSRRVLLPTGDEILQEKFSSMGNGFTFPLETLIFWGLAGACCYAFSDATAYGDDLIVPTDRYLLLTEVLTAVGFLVNKSKSYHTGLFRESCGKDYFSGIDVRPVYTKDWVSGQSLYVLHNWYVRHGDTERAKWVETHIHPATRIYGPDGYGDGHLIGDHPRRRPAKYDIRGYCGYFFDSYTTRTSKDQIPLARGEYVVSLYSIYRRSAGDLYVSWPADSAEPIITPFSLYYTYRGIGEGRTAPLALPEGDDDVKHLPLPGANGYKKITI